MTHFTNAGSGAINNTVHRHWGEIKRYLALFLAVLLLMSLLYVSVERVIRQQTHDYAELVAEHFSAKSRSMLRELELVSNTILRDSAVAQLRSDDDQQIIDRLEICNEIAMCLENSPYAEHAYLIPREAGDIYTEKAIFGNDSRKTLLDQAGITEADLIPKSDDTAYHLLNQSHMAPFCVATVRGLDGNITRSLVVTLRMSEFLNLFHEIDAELCTVFNNDVYISSYIRNIDDPAFDWRNPTAVSRLVGSPVACYYLDADGYTYLVAISQSKFNQPLRLILAGFCLFALALMLLAIIHIVRSVKRRRRQIESVISALPESYQGDQSLDQIYSGIRSSLEAYRTQQESFIQEQREHRLHHMLTRDIGFSRVEEDFASVGIDIDAGCYYVVTYFVTNLHHFTPQKEHDRDIDILIHLLFRSTVHEVAEKYEMPYAFCCGYKIGTAVFWGENSKALKKKILSLSEDVIDLMTNTYSMHMQVTISSPLYQVSMLPDGYEQTHRLRSFAKSINSTTTMISQETLEQSSSILLNGDFIRQEQILINTILVKKYDAVPSMVESILTGHVSPLRKNYALAQSRLTAVANNLIEGARMSAMNDDWKAQAERDLRGADSVESLLGAASSVYEQLAAASRPQSGPSDYLRVACEYIDQNLSDQNLNVTAICDAAEISVQRLTKMFQSEYGMAIAEYVNSCRIKMAKSLLANPDMTAVSIAQQIGYSNADTFTRNFKKIEGVTPTEYRRSIE